jgi:hypothetical protein
MHLKVGSTIILLLPLLSGADSPVRAGYGPLHFKQSFPESPAPFIIDVDPVFIAQTKVKASLTRASIDISTIQEYTEGVPSHNVTDVANYWASKYNWADIQKQLNKDFHHFSTTIPPLNSSSFTDPVQLHFVHHKSLRKDAIPLLFIHGWPGSFLEVAKILPLLTNPTDPDDPAFHVVAPSLPGFGFSPAPHKPGLGLKEVAGAFNHLMHQLNYSRYVIQGGDFGGHASRYMGAYFPESVVSILPNLFWVLPNTTDLERRAQNKTTAEENMFMASLDASKGLENAYWGIQSLLPQQIGSLLADSPVMNALWSYPGMLLLSPGYSWSIEELITWGMMSYIQGPYGSIRMYKELLRVSRLSESPWVYSLLL